jgi:beta-glucanase (GH16 family)
MSIFNIKLTPKVVERDWQINYTHSSRKKKTCEVCKKEMSLTEKATTFLKRDSVGVRTAYDSKYTCGHKESPCTQEFARRLQMELP